MIPKPSAPPVEPSWLVIARRYVGLAEVPGKETNPTIQKWLRSLGAWWNDDATPWCGTFVAHCVTEAGASRPKHWYRARAWLDWGVELIEPQVGAVVVFERKGGGHVGFVVGVDQNNRLMVLGGNQADRVTVAPFAFDRVLGYQWPVEFAQLRPTAGSLPLVESFGGVSTWEA